MKNVAIIISNSPHGNAKGREALDVALSLSDINHISLFFVDDGVFHLLPNQQPDQILMRDYIATLNMLELYDIEDVYASQESLQTRNLLTTKLNIPTKIIDSEALKQLLAKQNSILQF